MCLVLGACSSSGDVVDITKFKAPTLGDMFAKPDWADTTGSTKRIASRALTQDDYVNADGTCASSAPAPVAATPVENKPEGSEDPAAPAATPASAPVAPEPAAPASPRVIGGIGLGMSECDVVQRAGTPGRVDLSAGEKSDRNLVLTYMSGDRPGIEERHHLVGAESPGTRVHSIEAAARTGQLAHRRRHRRLRHERTGELRDEQRPDRRRARRSARWRLLHHDARTSRSDGSAS